MAWQKVKIRPEQELVVGGWVKGTGKAVDLGALLVGVYEDGALRYAGKIGAGFTNTNRAELLAAVAPLAADDPPFATPPPRAAARNAQWLRPELVIRAEFAGWTGDGLVRQAAYKGFELEKDPRESSASARRPEPCVDGPSPLRTVRCFPRARSERTHMTRDAGEIEAHLRAASDAILLLLTEVGQLERHKRGIPPGEARFDEVARSVRVVAQALAEFTEYEETWARNRDGRQNGHRDHLAVRERARDRHDPRAVASG